MKSITPSPSPSGEGRVVVRRRAICTFCGGHGDSMRAQWVRSQVGTLYWIPQSHEGCRRSALSLSLSLSMLLRHLREMTMVVRSA